MNDILNIDVTENGPEEPLTPEEVKTWIKVDGTDEDTIIEDLITECRQAVENYTNCSLVEKEVECTVWLDSRRYDDAFELPHGPVQGNPAVTQAENTITDYPKIEGKFLKVYGLCGLYKFVYTAGYEDVPQRLKQAILNEIAYRYQNRGDQTKDLTIGSTSICEAAVSMCLEYKRMSWV